MAAAEDLLAVIPDRDEDVTDEIYAEMLKKAKRLDSLKDTLQ